MVEQENEMGLAYLDSCDQMPLLLIHGFPLNSMMWEIQLEDLGDAARVLAPDLRGFGYSAVPSLPYSMDLLARDCAGLLDYLGITRPVVVCSLSMGGYVALEFYRQFPERVAGLILAATRAAPDSDEGKAGRDEMIKLVEAEGVTAVVAGMLPKLMSPGIYEAEPNVVEFVQEMMESASVEGVVGALGAMRDRPDSRPTLTEIDVPVLVIHGADDQLIPQAEAKAMADAVEGSLFEIVPDAGHLPNIEQPDIFNDAVIDFVEMVEELLYSQEY